MKISQSLLFAYAAAQGEDRWGSTDYYSFNYGFGGKQDSGIAFGMVDTAVVTDAAADHGLEAIYGYNSASAHYLDNLHYNGLLCWMCDFRLDLATEAESETCTGTSCQNAYARCLRHGMLMRCRGEQRTCMFEERRRHGVVYSVCTGCKQTDACVAHWRRNQRFTLPFMNFGDMSLRNLPSNTNNVADGVTVDQLPNHRPIYVDDECSTYQETRTEEAWRATAYNSATHGDLTNGGGNGINNEVYPMGWTPITITGGGAGVRGTNGKPFSTDGSNVAFTGHRVNLGLSYSKFAYDGANNLQLNAQLSQWESTCRWCCHARPDTVCNIEMREINSSPFSTKCGNAVGTRRDVAVTASGTTYAVSNIALILAALKTRITTNAEALVNAQAGYWQLLTNTDAASVTQDINGTGSGANKMTDDLYADDKNKCSLSNSQWANSNDSATLLANRQHYPQGIHNKFRFFQPFNIAQSHADYYNADQYICNSASSNAGTYCINGDSTCTGGACDVQGAYVQGPRFWMQMFQRSSQYDLSAYYRADAVFTAKFPAVGEGRNSAGMDKFAGRGNLSRSTIDKATLQNNSELQHFFQHQTDMVSQENRDFFDGRARDAQTSIANSKMYLRRYDNNDFWTT
jgi:hypothetical protein